jgi:hypothetical protein
MGDLIEDLREDALLRWQHDYARAMTRTQAWSQRLKSIETRMIEHTSGIAHVMVDITGHKKQHSDEYYYRILVRAKGTYVIDPRSL